MCVNSLLFDIYVIYLIKESLNVTSAPPRCSALQDSEEIMTASVDPLFFPYTVRNKRRRFRKRLARTIRTRAKDAISRACVAHARWQWTLCSRLGVCRLPKWTSRERKEERERKKETRSRRKLQIIAVRA